MSEAVIGVLIGAFVGFAGVAAQLWRDAKQRERERLMQLRRDVFLEAAEGVSGSQQFFFRFANTDIPFSKPGDVQSSKPGWLNKLHIVASIETIEAFAAADRVLGRSSFDLLRRRNLLQMTDDQIKITQQSAEHTTNYQNEMRQEIRRIASEPPTERSVSRAEWARDNYLEAQKQLADLASTLEQLVNQRWALQRTLFEKSSEYYAEFQDYLSDALVALRGEIDLPIDLTRFKRVMAEHNASVREEVRKMLDDVEADESSENLGGLTSR
jgi:hypothetical protein